MSEPHKGNSCLGLLTLCRCMPYATRILKYLVHRSIARAPLAQHAVKALGEDQPQVAEEWEWFRPCRATGSQSGALCLQRLADCTGTGGRLAGWRGHAPGMLRRRQRWIGWKPYTRSCNDTLYVSVRSLCIISGHEAQALLGTMAWQSHGGMHGPDRRARHWQHR